MRFLWSARNKRTLPASTNSTFGGFACSFSTSSSLSWTAGKNMGSLFLLGRCNTPQRNKIPLCSALIDIPPSSREAKYLIRLNFILLRLITFVSHSVLFLRNASKCVQLKIVLFHDESVIDYKIFTPGDQFWFFLSFNHHFYSIFWDFGVFWHIPLWYVCLWGESQKKLHNWTQATITRMSGLHYLTFNLGIYAWGRSVISWFINSKRPLDRSLKALQSSHS